MLGQGYQKLVFCDIQAMVFLQSYVIMSRGHLLETENKTIYVEFLVKQVVAVVKKFRSWLPRREFLKQYLTQKQNGFLQVTVV